MKTRGVNGSFLFYEMDVFLQFFNEVTVGLDYMDSAIQKYQDLYVTGPAKTFNYAQATADELRDIYFSCPSRALARYCSIIIIL